MAALALLAACAAPEARPPIAPPAHPLIETSVYLSAAGPDRAGARFDYPSAPGAETRVVLRSSAAGPLPATIRCDGPGRLALGAETEPGFYLRPGGLRRFTLPGRHESLRPRLILPAETTSCSLSWGDNSLELVAETRADPAVAGLDAEVPGCTVPPLAGLDALSRAFFATGSLSQTCPRPLGTAALYPDETEALGLRLDRLTGSRVDRAALAAGDPEMALDFSHAPHFDEIVVSYLHIRADVSGYLVIRALAFHAAQGTKIRIAVSSSTMLGQDRRVIEALASQYPNVQIQYFRWTPSRPLGPAGILDSYQRVHHVKIFAALSPEPGQSFVMIGGRNLHDMFFFPELDHKPTLPILHDYSKETNLLANPFAFFTPYEDFEIALFDRAEVRDILAQFGKFWNRDTRTETMAPALGAVTESAAAPRQGLVRHFLSLPWADGRGLLDLYVGLIDAAEEEVLAISPFTYPPAELDAALLRARARGVRVQLITRGGSDEPPAMFVNGLNADYYERRGEALNIGSYILDARLTHTKLIVIDRRLSVVSSANLNPRSFFHDGENGLLILDSGVSAELHRLLERYAAAAQPMPPRAFFRALGRTLAPLGGLTQFF